MGVAVHALLRMPFLWGGLEVESVDSHVVRASFIHEPLEEACHPALAFLRGQLVRYLEGSSVDLAKVSVDTSSCTAFQRGVYTALRGVGWGESTTYGELADALGCKSPRAVGGALAKNRHLLFVPCHRVMASRGLGGFSEGTALKRALFELEGGLC